MPCWSLFKFLYVDVNLNVRACCYGHHECHKMYNVRDVDRYKIPDDVVDMRKKHLLGIIPTQCESCLVGN